MGIEIVAPGSLMGGLIKLAKVAPEKETGFPPLEKSPNAIADEPTVEAETGIIKSLDEQRYTFGPLYSPGILDAHQEWTTSESLQQAVWNFARNGDRQINKQHQRGEHVGEVVELVTWPQEVVTKMAVPGKESREVTLPAGTAYVGVIWSEAAWPEVKSGRIGGYSLGGRGIRVSDQMPTPSS